MSESPQPTRWVTETKEGHSRWYIDRFRTLAQEGEDLVGEARLLDAMVPGEHESSTQAAGPDASPQSSTAEATPSTVRTLTRS